MYALVIFLRLRLLALILDGLVVVVYISKRELSAFLFLQKGGLIQDGPRWVLHNLYCYENGNAVLKMTKAPQTEIMGLFTRLNNKLKYSNNISIKRQIKK